MRKKQKNLKKRPRNWFLKGSTSESMSLERKQVRSKQEDANKETMGLYTYNRGERRICAEEEEDVSIMKRGEIYKFIKELLRKEYIRPLKSSQTALVFFVGKKDGKKHMVQDYWHLNE